MKLNFSNPFDAVVLSYLFKKYFIARIFELGGWIGSITKNSKILVTSHSRRILNLKVTKYMLLMNSGAYQIVEMLLVIRT